MRHIYWALYSAGMLIVICGGGVIVELVYPKMSVFETLTLAVLFALAATLSSMEARMAYERDKK